MCRWPMLAALGLALACGCRGWPPSEGDPLPPDGFDACFAGERADFVANWRGVTDEEGFDDPEVRRLMSSERREVLQMIADLSMRSHWSVAGGCLRFDGREGGGPLATRREYEDFDLVAEWRSADGEGWVCVRGVAPVRTASFRRPAGEWNRLCLSVRGDRVSVWANGLPVADGLPLENRFRRGAAVPEVGRVELHAAGGAVDWRNVFVRAL